MAYPSRPFGCHQLEDLLRKFGRVGPPLNWREPSSDGPLDGGQSLSEELYVLFNQRGEELHEDQAADVAHLGLRG